MRIDGKWPEPNHRLWKLKSLRVTVRVTSNGPTKARKRLRKVGVLMPKGRSTVRMYDICHNEVGGVTNGRFKVEFHGLSGLKLVMTSPPHVSGMLVDVLDPLEIGCPQHGRIPLPEKLNTFCGLLDWRKRNDHILAPTIYSKTEGVI